MGCERGHSPQTLLTHVAGRVSNPVVPRAARCTALQQFYCFYCSLVLERDTKSAEGGQFGLFVPASAKLSTPLCSPPAPGALHTTTTLHTVKMDARDHEPRPP